LRAFADTTQAYPQTEENRMVESGGTSTTLLLGALIFLIALAATIFVGTMVYIVRARAKARDERMPSPPSTPPLSPTQHAKPVLPAEEADVSPETLPLEPPGRPGEVMRVIRDQQTGRILVEVEGQQYAHIREIADARVGRRVLWAIADLIRFTGGMAANPQAVHSAAQQAAHEQGIALPQDVERPEDGQAPTGESVAARPELPVSRPPSPAPSTALAVPPAADQGRGARYSVSAFFQRGLQPSPVSTPQPGPSSFVDEIEEILQDLIHGRATPLPYDVHVSIGPEDRLQVEVGPEVYGSADEVPDPEVQALIRAAVAEWEKR
jgi:hypothetical protein